MLTLGTMAKFAIVFIFGLCTGIISVKSQSIKIQKFDSLHKQTSDSTQLKTDSSQNKTDNSQKQNSDTKQVKEFNSNLQKIESSQKKTLETTIKNVKSINIQKLDSLNKLTLDQFDTYITSQGYLFFKTLPSEKYGDAILYAYKQNDSTLKAEYFIKKYLNTNTSGQKVISFQTNYVSEYLGLKKDLLRGGFVETKTETSISPGISFTYNNEKIKATVILSIYVSSDTKKTNIYEITLKQN